MKKKTSNVSSITVRLCANIKSKRHPDTQCPYTASHGEFCSRHYKNPVRFQEKVSLITLPTTKEKNAAKRIQIFWKSRVGLLRFRRQGPAAQIVEISENNNDVCTLESIATIPLLYRWSYADAKKHIWLFDIRSLSMLRSQDSKTNLLNPYTREEFSLKASESFQKRCTQLRAHKYCLLHTNEMDLTETQVWHQNLLDMTMKYDMLGYHMSLDWFNTLNREQCYTLYYELWELWMYRLQLPNSIKNKVVPRWNDETSLLFKWLPAEIKNKRDIKWWHKNLLEILNRLVSGILKEHRTLGALYGMTGLAIASPTVHEFYPWLVEMDD